MDMLEGGVERNRKIIIAAAVGVVILVIIYLYTAGHLSGIVWGDGFTRASEEAASVGGLAIVPYKSAIRDAFGNRVAHGTITKTYSVTHLAVKEASRRYNPAAVIAVERDVVSGVPAEISTSYVERSHLTMRMQCRRFGRLTNAYSKTLPNHAAAVSLHIAFYNLCSPQAGGFCFAVHVASLNETALGC
jgi:IS1 family transposase